MTVPLGQQDFSDPSWVETDSGTHLAKTSASVLTITSLDRNAANVDLIEKDFGANAFSSDFEFRFKIDPSTIVDFCAVWHCTVSNSSGKTTHQKNVDNESFFSVLNFGNVSPNLLIRLNEYDSGTQYSADYSRPSYTLPVYCKLIRSNSVGANGTLYLETYSDSGFTTLLSAISIALHTSKKTFSRIQAVSANNDGGGAFNWSGTFENFDVVSVSPFIGEFLNSLEVGGLGSPLTPLNRIKRNVNF